MRTDRKPNELRALSLTPGASKYAEGSCLIQMGHTHVLCTASIEDKVPHFLRNAGKGWVTAEYGMLPRSTHKRMDREVTRMGPSGRTQEIQRLIGRSLRAIVDTKLLGERTIRIDCDVIQADGGTRTASITGAYVALHYACRHLVDTKQIATLPLTDSIAAISCGILGGEALLDLDYLEDSSADTDANFVLTGRGKIVEIQATAEAAPFEEAELMKMMELARSGMKQLQQKQLAAIMGK